MATSVEVFDKIRQMSQRTLNQQHRILLHEIAEELSLSNDTVLVLLTELQNRGLIRIHQTTVASVSLTNYGTNNENPPGGLNS